MGGCKPRDRHHLLLFSPCVGNGYIRTDFIAPVLRQSGMTHFLVVEYSLLCDVWLKDTRFETMLNKRGLYSSEGFCAERAYVWSQLVCSVAAMIKAIRLSYLSHFHI